MKYLFEEARKLYPGKKRGFQYEWDNFQKKHKKKADDIASLLKPAIEAQIAYREDCAKRNEWCAPWKNFQTWINGGWWTEEVPQNGKQKKEKCRCGKSSTHSLIVYFKDGARTVYRCDNCPDPEPDWRKREQIEAEIREIDHE